MKKISSIFVALCMAATVFAQASSASDNMLPKRQSVFRTPFTTNALDQRVMERLNAEKEEAEVIKSPAAVQADTIKEVIELEADARWEILHPKANRWGVQSHAGNYDFDLAWYSESLTGTFTKKDMVEALRGYAN